LTHNENDSNVTQAFTYLKFGTVICTRVGCNIG